MGHAGLGAYVYAGMGGCGYNCAGVCVCCNGAFIVCTCERVLAFTVHACRCVRVSKVHDRM